MNEERSDIELKNLDGYIKELSELKSSIIKDLERRTDIVKYTTCVRCKSPLFPSPKGDVGIKWSEAKMIIDEHQKQCSNPFPNCSKCERLIYNDEELSRIGDGFICPNCVKKYQIGFEER